MIEKVEMYAAECDSCEEQFEMYDGFIALNDRDALKDEIQDSNWSITFEGKTYCEKCHVRQWNESEDELHAVCKDTGISIGQIS